MLCTNCGKNQIEGVRFCSDCGAALSAAGGDAGLDPSKPKKKRKGCIVALIVAGVLGVLAIPMLIIAAIAIPNLLNAIDRGKQKRTMADLRSIGTAIEEYSIDHDIYPTAADLESLADLLTPRYIRHVPPNDGWENPFLAESQPGSYRLHSFGKDGLPEGCDGGATNRFAADICFENGSFTQWPEGAQR